jgi:glutathione S-transferase
MITISAFRWVPPFAQGFVRDLRVRWALEEAGLPYKVELIGPADQVSAAYRARQPFGQVPYFEEDGRALFESGAIVLHIAERSEMLLPADAQGKGARDHLAVRGAEHDRSRGRTARGDRRLRRERTLGGAAPPRRRAASRAAAVGARGRAR